MKREKNYVEKINLFKFKIYAAVMVQIAVRRKACYLAIVTEENGIIILCQLRNVRENHIFTYEEILDTEVDQFLNTNDMRDCLLASFGGVYTQYLFYWNMKISGKRFGTALLY